MGGTGRLLGPLSNPDSYHVFSVRCFSGEKKRTEQNHRMFRVGRDLCGSSSPTPLLKQDHPEQAAQTTLFCSIHESGPCTKRCKTGMVRFGRRARDRVSQDF